MPRVYLTECARIERDATDKDDYIRTMVAARMMKTRMKKKELARDMGLTPPTMIRRLEAPDTMTIGEFRRLIHLIGITPEEIRKCI